MCLESRLSLHCVRIPISGRAADKTASSSQSLKSRQANDSLTAFKRFLLLPVAQAPGYLLDEVVVSSLPHWEAFYSD